MKKIIILFVACLACLLSFSCKASTPADTIVVGASVTPHAEILEQCRSYVESKGYKLKIVTYTDYILPNVGVSDGSLDANYFQHQPYLDDYNEKNGTEIVSVLKVHFEPIGLYGGKQTSLENIPDGATIGVPNDTTNRARALYLLKDLGLIDFDESKGLEVTVNDITVNEHHLVIKELEAAQLPIQLASFDYVVVNGNYALSGNILDKLIETEAKDSVFAEKYGNVLCVNKGNENTEKTKILIEALSQEEVIKYINESYNGTVIALH